MCEEMRIDTAKKTRRPKLYSWHPNNLVVPGVDTLNSVHIEPTTLH